ncbi:MAG: hypothetical protein LBC92_03660 [Rickettsiales bacterium]|jgi:hypothetical protein|nr:hypothetical protein [Rickettsiales bacterium]
MVVDLSEVHGDEYKKVATTLNKFMESYSFREKGSGSYKNNLFSPDSYIFGGSNEIKIGKKTASFEGEEIQNDILVGGYDANSGFTRKLLKTIINDNINCYEERFERGDLTKEDFESMKQKIKNIDSIVFEIQKNDIRVNPLVRNIDGIDDDYKRLVSLYGKMDIDKFKDPEFAFKEYAGFCLKRIEDKRKALKDSKHVLQSKIKARDDSVSNGSRKRDETMDAMLNLHLIDYAVHTNRLSNIKTFDEMLNGRDMGYIHRMPPEVFLEKADKIIASLTRYAKEYGPNMHSSAFGKRNENDKQDRNIYDSIEKLKELTKGVRNEVEMEKEQERTRKIEEKEEEKHELEVKAARKIEERERQIKIDNLKSVISADLKFMLSDPEIKSDTNMKKIAMDKLELKKRKLALLEEQKAIAEYVKKRESELEFKGIESFKEKTEIIENEVKEKFKDDNGKSDNKNKDGAKGKGVQNIQRVGSIKDKKPLIIKKEPAIFNRGKEKRGLGGR